MTKRIGYIDIAKGIGILLVALRHNYCIQDSAPFLHQTASSFNVPLFFFLSGFIFHLPPSFMELLKKKFYSLMFPFLFTTFLIYFANTFFSRMDLLVAFKRMIKASFYAGGWYLEWIHLWFLPHLFVVSIFAYVIIKFIRNPYIRWIILAGGLAINQSALPYFWPLQLTIAGISYQSNGLPFSLDLVFICVFFFLLGNEVEHLDYQKLIKNRFLLLISFLALLALNLFTDARLDLFLRIFDSLWINTAKALLGIFFVLSLSFQIEVLIPSLTAVLIYFGRISLYILIFHWYIQEALRVKLLKLTENIPISGWGAFIASVLCSILIYELFIKNNSVALYWFGRSVSSTKDRVKDL